MNTPMTLNSKNPLPTFAFLRLLSVASLASVAFFSLLSPSSAIDVGTMDVQGDLWHGGWQLVEEKYFDSPAASYTFSNLDGDNDEEYRLISRVIGGSDADIYLRPNNDSTSNNYGWQEMYGIGNGSYANYGTANGIYLFSTNANKVAMNECLIYARSGQVRTALSEYVYGISGTSFDRVVAGGYSWNNTSDNIVSLSITGGSGALGAGSHLFLFKRAKSGSAASTGTRFGNVNVKGALKAGVFQLVETKEITSTVASVTFSNLDGNADILYLVEMRVVSGASAISNVLIRPNNDSDNNYGYQMVAGYDSSPSAATGTSYNGIIFGTVETNGDVGWGECLIYAKNGYVRTSLLEEANRMSGTTVTQLRLIAQSWNNTESNITSLVVIGRDVGNALGPGTIIHLYKLVKKSS